MIQSRSTKKTSCLKLYNTEPERLNPSEAKILMSLYDSFPNAVNKKTLESIISDRDTLTIEKVITTLRGYLKIDNKETAKIDPVYKVGYKLIDSSRK